MASCQRPRLRKLSEFSVPRTGPDTLSPPTIRNLRGSSSRQVCIRFAGRLLDAAPSPAFHASEPRGRIVPHAGGAGAGIALRCSCARAVGRGAARRGRRWRRQCGPFFRRPGQGVQILRRPPNPGGRPQRARHGGDLRPARTSGRRVLGAGRRACCRRGLGVWQEPGQYPRGSRHQLHGGPHCDPLLGAESHHHRLLVLPLVTEVAVGRLPIGAVAGRRRQGQ
mmetsp:Transcript_6678/g.24993  ORF Transcript_6678/g.24993 Transcript_6678/m.24993 type:complete len:223 (-) Transcript_6678:667-1335(-)